MKERLDLSACWEVLRSVDPLRRYGHVLSVAGSLIECDGPLCALNDFCEIANPGAAPVRAQVIGFREGRLLCLPLEETDGLRPGAEVVARGSDAQVPVGPGLLGRVIDGFGRPLDNGPPIVAEQTYRIERPPPGPLEREPIRDRLVTGIRAIDGLLACGRGQRVGIFGGSGVGKSTLLGAMSKHNDADLTVIALIGERNREVRDFIEHELGPEGLARSILVVATSDRPAPLRIRAALLAVAVSEYFRDQGQSVLLVMDSVTRLAMAQREIGLAAGEPPGQRGYPPSVFNLLPRLFERAGNFKTGSITGFFTVLVEGDDFNEPICDAVRSILDGHIVLSRQLGAMGHYPAIDVLQSVSRLAQKLVTPEEQQAASRIRQALAEYAQAQDLINLGAYVAGTNAAVDAAVRVRPRLLDFLRQRAEDFSSSEQTTTGMRELAAMMES